MLFAASVCLALLLQNEWSDSVIEFIVHVPFDENHIFISIMLYAVAAITAISFVHEPLHGICFVIFGGRVRYGLKMGCAYTQEISGIAINKYKFIVVLLMPLFVISVVSLLVLPGWIGHMIFMLNAFGSIGDIYMSAVILLNGRKCSRVIDRSYGFEMKAD